MEAALLAVDDAIGKILWTRSLLSAQGIYVPTKTLYY